MKKYIVILMLLALLVLSGCSSSQKTTAVSAGGDLEIPIAELSEHIKIYSFTVDGLNMEVLAARDADGTVRTAFNTCQVCNGSRKAYFVEQGDKVVCQNCGNAFGREDVGVLSGGRADQQPVSETGHAAVYQKPAEKGGPEWPGKDNRQMWCLPTEEST